MVGLAMTTFLVPSLVDGKGPSGMSLVWLLATEEILGSWKPFPRHVVQRWKVSSCFYKPTFLSLSRNCSSLNICNALRKMNITLRSKLACPKTSKVRLIMILWFYEVAQCYLFTPPSFINKCYALATNAEHNILHTSAWTQRNCTNLGELNCSPVAQPAVMSHTRNNWLGGWMSGKWNWFCKEKNLKTIELCT